MMVQNELNPTLWRTCRMLAGTTRVKLLRGLVLAPGRTVSELAFAVKVGVSDASQELRRIQSRGLLQVERRGTRAYYRLQSDPQVASSAPLLRAVKMIFMRWNEQRDAEFVWVAQGLAHPKRIALVRELRVNPKREADLPRLLGMSVGAFRNHVQCLVQTGWVQRQGDWVVLTPQRHPLAVVLLSLVEDAKGK